MIRNYFYLIVGLVCLLSAVTHTLNGLETAIASLNHSTMDAHNKVVFTYVWHIIGVENVVFGVALLIMAFHKERTGGKYIAWFIIAILVLRWLTILFFSLLNNVEEIATLIPETIVIWIVIVLLWFGIKINNKQLTQNHKKTAQSKNNIASHS
ncbi:hypothetical protein [Tannerella sp.]|uniref:hypothetical protein n=1 Tax=Tannerella sp. TaxID=2382127 RepID=UPI0026DC5AD3|nr:hypothetical protein [Tannerella sp.]MDO4702482.1 hypothetical protein [Tannerella sp.]